MTTTVILHHDHDGDRANRDSVPVGTNAEIAAVPETTAEEESMAVNDNDSANTESARLESNAEIAAEPEKTTVEKEAAVMTCSGKNEEGSLPPRCDDDSAGGIPLRHSFAAGDHVIRWEMLPIAWPIQIHGIVLETSDEFVTLADFGLTVKPAEDDDDGRAQDAGEREHLEDISTSSVETPVQPFINHPVYQRSAEVVVNAWEKLRPNNTQEKQRRQRINVLTITEQSELSRWSKVNYGGALFGGNKPSENIDGKSSAVAVTSADNKASGWWQNMTSSFRNNNRSPEAAEEGKKKDGVVEDSVGEPTSGETLTSSSINSESSGENSSAAVGVASSENKAAGWWKNVTSSFRKNSETPPSEENKENGGVAERPLVENSVAKPSSREMLKRRTMNPAMAEILRKKEASSNAKWSSSLSPSPKKTLPKSDPPKVILARTRFLLKHGEAILPPYHVFHSNSECIAVFCTTGRWSTLQAAVFLHSSAIGNAKGAAAITLSTAAAVPILAPAVAGLGLAMVGVPWWMLRDSKVKWEEATASLNDLFWSEAEPEVFLECIEHWSGLGGSSSP